MKKYLLVMFAAVLALTFSAFTPIETRPDGPYQYNNGGVMTDVPPGFNVRQLCPVGDDHDCKIEINEEEELIYLDDVIVRWE